jgi:hypothetical protein
MLMLGNKPNGTRVDMKKASHARKVFSNRWLKVGFVAIAASAAVAFSWKVGVTVRPLEATVQLERLTAKVEQTKFIQPETALAITRLVDQNGYDCDRVVCHTQLQARNRAVRDRLKTLIAHKTDSGPNSPGLESKTPSSLMPASATTALGAGRLQKNID